MVLRYLKGFGEGVFPVKIPNYLNILADVICSISKMIEVFYENKSNSL
jgi:hypothetical protein